MDKKIPYLFEDAAIYQPLVPLSEALPNVGRTRVRVFYRYDNRNGSYITDEVATEIINSAPTKPVIGFFNWEKKDYTTHMGASIVSAYGYIPEEPHFAWEWHQDNDGVMREYACFDVILHTEYFPEASAIISHPQSMELNEKTISGSWGIINGEPYFIYSHATLKGLCVLGKDVEPCFEGAEFFAQNEESKFNQFSSLLLELQEKVKETENFEKGGEKANMDVENMVEQVVEEQPVVEFEAAAVAETIAAVANEDAAEPVQEFEATAIAETIAVEPAQEFEVNETSESEAAQEEENVDTYTISEGPGIAIGSESDAIVEFHCTQEEYERLVTENADFAQRITDYESQINSLNETITNYQNQLAEANSRISEYEAAAAVRQAQEREELIASYENLLSSEEIDGIRERSQDFTYEELDAQLALTFARKNISKQHKVVSVPLANTEEIEFAQYMNKYKK